jgi:hypothetical protein
MSGLFSEWKIDCDVTGVLIFLDHEGEGPLPILLVSFVAVIWIPVHMPEGGYGRIAPGRPATAMCFAIKHACSKAALPGAGLLRSFSMLKMRKTRR